MLNELDKEMEWRDFAMSDTPMFIVHTEADTEAHKIVNKLFSFLKNKLKLPINREKSGIRRPVNFKVLGYGFVPTYQKGEKGKYQLVASDKSWKNLKKPETKAENDHPEDHPNEFR